MITGEQTLLLKSTLHKPDTRGRKEKSFSAPQSVCLLQQTHSSHTPSGACFPAGGGLWAAPGSLGAAGSRCLCVLLLILELGHGRGLKVGIAHPDLDVVRALQQPLVQLPRALPLALPYLKVYVALHTQARRVNTLSGCRKSVQFRSTKVQDTHSPKPLRTPRLCLPAVS